MSETFPEITSFGTLFAFAQALEEGLLALSEQAASRGPEAGEVAARAQKRHHKRVKQLERLRRERLNEVVLQPLAGVNSADHIPDLSCPEDPAKAREALAAAERKAAAFYEEAAEKARSVLGGVDKTLLKLAGESRDLAAALG